MLIKIRNVDVDKNLETEEKCTKGLPATGDGQNPSGVLIGKCRDVLKELINCFVTIGYSSTSKLIIFMISRFKGHPFNTSSHTLS